LRERGDDVVLLAEHFARKASGHDGTAPRFSPAALDVLHAHPWPGNVRELRNVVQTLVFLADGRRMIDAEHLHQALSRHSVPASPPTPADSTRAGSCGPQDLRHLQREAMLAALRESQGNVSRAARILGIARSTLYARLAEWNLKPAAASRQR